MKLKEIARANISKQMAEQMHRDLDAQLRALSDDKTAIMRNVEEVLIQLLII